MTEAPRLSERVVFGEATTRRLRVDHRPVRSHAFGPDHHHCQRCGVPCVWRHRGPGRGYWQHVARGRVVTP